MRTVSRVLGAAVFIGTLFAIVCQPLCAATARARVSAEVLDPACIRGRAVVECGRAGMQLPNACLKNAVAQFSISGSQDHGFSIILPRELHVADHTGQAVADCSFAGTLVEHDPASSRINVAVTARIQPLIPSHRPCSANFDVIVAYD